MNNEQDKEPTIESLDFSKPDYQFTPGAYHEWRQKGFFMVCKSCEIMHAVYIGPEKILIGLDEKGQPLFKKRN